ncbi:PleD family two-component system response regulator [Pseudomonas nitroreducens]|uniref:response regulator n=1 Tax=Pseudomonas nitroreducens TaxID=46680 RepID=UPI00351D6377
MSNSPLRVMLVDDSRTIRKTGEVMLQKAGCEVLCAVDGFECLARALDFKPDLFFIDVLMPRLNGYQTSQLIRSRDAFKAVPIVMLSSKDGLFDIALGKKNGATDYITKPFNQEDLVGAVTKHCPNFTPAL